MKQKPCIDFQITRNCNYRCTYCSQSKKFEEQKFQDASDETIQALLKLLKTLDKTWEVTISGGEPLMHPKFFELLSKIKEINLKVSIISNFSFPLKSYKKAADILGENLVLLFASFHSTQVKDVDEFLEKASEFNKYKHPSSKFTVGSVLTDDNVEILKEVSQKLQQNDIKFVLQHMRIKNEFVKYSDAAEEFAKTNHPQKNSSFKTFGKICSAGCRFLFVYEDGSAYRCYSSRLIKKHILGNIKDKNFKLYSCPIPCLLPKCTCPKPYEYGMIDFQNSNLPKALVLTAVNLLFLPQLLIKNAKNIKTKLVQGFSLKQ